MPAQENNQYIFRHLTQQDGLLHNNVFCITQDKKGFMWIATQNGLQRYDGLRFTNYQESLLSLPDIGGVPDLYADDKNNIWLKTFEIAELNTLTKKLVIYEKKNLPSNSAFHFDTYTDEFNRPWLLGDFGIYYMDTLSKKMKLSVLSQPGFDAKNGNLTLYDSIANCTWYKGPLGLMCFDATTRKIYTHTCNPFNHPLLKSFNAKPVTYFLADRQHNIWIATWEGDLYKYNPLKRKIKKYTLAKITNQQKNRGIINASCMYEDKQGSLWIGTDNAGLLRYNGNDNFTLIKARNIQEQSLHFNYSFYCITEDKEGNIWLGTDKGISIFNPYRLNFKTINHEENNKNSLPKNEITSAIQGSDGSIYIGTWGGGFSVYDKQLSFKKTILPKGPYELPLVWCFAENDDKNIWAGAQHGYLHIYNPATATLKTIHPPELQNFTVRCLQKDHSGNIWIGLHNGKIVEWEKSSQKFLISREAGIINNNAVKNIFIDKANTIWASTNNGFLQFDTEKHLFIHRYLPIQKNTSIEGNNIGGIEQINDSVLAIATFRTGLFYLNTNTKKIYQNQQLPLLGLLNVHALKKDVQNNLWLTTDYEFYQLKINENKLLKYNLDRGLINSSFELPYFLPLQDGRWLTATYSEAVVFNPAVMIASGQNTRNVTITGFKLFDKEIYIDSLLYTGKPLKLKSNENFISLEFTSLQYAGVGEINFSYRLSGVDREWVKADSKGIATYTSLAPGNYVFSVKSGDKDAASNITILSIFIEPPFFLTWWFKLLAVISLLLTVYFLINRRIKVIRHEAELKHRIVEAEINALRSQMNPHFIFNCLSAIDNLIQTHQPDKATTYLSRFAKLLRSLLESSKNNVVPFYKDFKTLELFLQLEKFRCNNKFSYTLQADEELLQGDYKVPPLIVQPFVENAIHHGLLNKETGQRHLSVKASLQNNFINYTIIDNGVGRLKALEIKKLNKPDQQSYGIQITTERIDLHNKNNHLKDKANDILITDTIKDGMADGTQVQIRLKI